MAMMMTTRSTVVTLTMVASLLSWPFLALFFIRAYLIGLGLGGLIGLARFTCKDAQRR